jgi:AraC family transcriptional regulator
MYLQGQREGLAPGEWVTEVRVPVVNALASLSQHDKERLMNPEIVSLPAFVVVGMLYRGKNEHGEIPAMWSVLNTRWEELDAIQASGVAYGVCGNMGPDGVFEYVAGVEPRPGAAIPAGMVRWEVPAQTYAVFPCTLQTIHQAYEQAYQVWLPGSGYRATGGLDMELYPETFEPEDPARQQMFIYIPVER